MTTLSLVKDNTQHTAKRLVNTKSLSRMQWLEVRNKGIGSSDAAAACGFHPYQSKLALWMIKTGRLSQSESNAIEGHAPLYWGTQLEPLIAKHYQAKTGNKVRRVNAVLQHPDADRQYMLANLDYAVVGSDDVQILECKSAGEHGAKLWKDGVPLYVICQVQHQLAVTGKQAAHVCVLICGHETRLYKVVRDDTLIQHLMQAEKRFWHCVTTDTMPSPDHSESAAKALKTLYPAHKKAKQIDCRDDTQKCQWFKRLLEHKQAVDVNQQQFDLYKHKLQQHMQDAELALFNEGSISWKKCKDSTSLDSKALLAARPDLLVQYPKVKQGARRFVVYRNA